MTELDRTWARTQVEAMADGSLSAVAANRMRALMNTDPALRAEVERARELRGSLRQLARQPVPRGLGRRLWRMPNAGKRRPVVWIPAFALASVAMVAIGVGLQFSDERVSADELARQSAVQDFALVVAYLQKSAMMARNGVNEAVGSGMIDALVLSRDAIGRSAVEIDEGAEDDTD